MKVLMPYNNNIILCEDESGIEFIAVGKGIGFSKKKGDRINEQNITQRFYPKTQKEQHKLMKILNDIPERIIEPTSKILESAEKSLNKKFSPMTLVTLADHIAAAMERCKTSKDMKSPLQEEIEYIYPQEYGEAKGAVEYINKALNVSLPESESVYIAMHFVNAASNDSSLSETLEITQILSEIISIIKNQFKNDIDSNLPGYNRFLAHLRYFVIRQLRGERVSEEDMKELYEIAKKKYPKEYECVKVINVYLGEKYNFFYSENERFYLLLHIARILNRN